MSTAPYILEQVSLNKLREMARKGVFTRQGDENVRSMDHMAVTLRDTPDDREADDGAGEKNLPRPGLIITYLGSSYPTEAGQNCQDDSRVKLLIQLIDDVAPVNSQGRKTYHYWASEIRKELQANPYRAEIDPETADIYLIHVNQLSRADSRRYHLHQQFKAGLEVTAFVREPRT